MRRKEKGTLIEKCEYFQFRLNNPFYICVLKALAFEWKRDWSCFAYVNDVDQRVVTISTT